MRFEEAYEALKAGLDVKRKHWAGFWRKNNNHILMFCKDGSIIPLGNSEDDFFTIDNMMQDDWVVVSNNENVKFDILTFSFGEAIRKLKNGERVARKGWNGKNQYVELASNISYVNSKNETINSTHHDIGNKALAFVGTSGVQLGWLASQADMLAEDWYVVL